MAHSTTPNVRAASRFFKALGEETRLRIVALLAHGELCVCHVEAALGLTQPTASRHLSVLRHAGVVEPRRAGRWVHYRLATQTDAACRDHLRALVNRFARHRGLRQNVKRVLKEKGHATCR